MVLNLLWPAAFASEDLFEPLHILFVELVGLFRWNVQCVKPDTNGTSTVEVTVFFKFSVFQKYSALAHSVRNLILRVTSLRETGGTDADGAEVVETAIGTCVCGPCLRGRIPALTRIGPRNRSTPVLARSNASDGAQIVHRHVPKLVTHFLKVANISWCPRMGTLCLIWVPPDKKYDGMGWSLLWSE